VVARGFDVAIIEMLSYQTDWLSLRRLHRRTPLVSFVHDVVPHRHSMPRAAERRLLSLLYSASCTGQLVVYSTLLKDELVGEFGVAPDRVSVIPHPLDTSAGCIPASSRAPTRPFVLFFGTLRANKGLDVLISALDGIGSAPPFDVVVAGEGSSQQREFLERAAERLPFLRLELGHVSDSRKKELHSQASVLVLPYTEFHSSSGVLADAYAYRIPVVASDIGTLGATIGADGTGWLVPPGEPHVLAHTLRTAMKELANGNVRVDELAQAAARHDFSRTGPMLREVCVKAIADRRRTDEG
jgi:glycosyltransferase involved in cell wall biosynthesis